MNGGEEEAGHTESDVYPTDGPLHSGTQSLRRIKSTTNTKMVCVYVCMSVCMCVCMCVCVCVHLCVCVQACALCVHVYVCLSVCLYIGCPARRKPLN